jgi:hypothetical protein
MGIEFRQTAPDVWEVWENTAAGRCVYIFDRCLINYHKRLNPQVMRIENYDQHGRIRYLWQRAQHFRGRPTEVLWRGARTALLEHLRHGRAAA